MREFAVDKRKLRRVHRSKGRKSVRVHVLAHAAREVQRNEDERDCVIDAGAKCIVQPRIDPVMVLLMRANVQPRPGVLDAMHNVGKCVDDEQLQQHLPPADRSAHNIIGRRQQIEHPHGRQIAKHEHE